MKSSSLQTGNALVTLIVAIIIATVIYFLLVPEAKRKLKAQEQEKLPSALASQLGEATNRPLPKNQPESYEGVLSWSKKDSVTINPFETTKDQATSNRIEKLIKPNPKPEIKEQPKNLITLSPLGHPFPSKSNYLAGYDLKYIHGTLTTTIDNISGDSDLMVFLKYHGRINATVTNESKLARAFFVKKGEKFDVISLDSGAYSMVWVRLKDGAQAPTQPFLLYKDVKFQYNQVLKFH
jgi:hypothetical protein